MYVFMYAGPSLDHSSGYELMYRDLGKWMHFSFFTIQFFTPTQKITVSKKYLFPKPRHKNETLSCCYR